MAEFHRKTRGIVVLHRCILNPADGTFHSLFLVPLRTPSQHYCSVDVIHVSAIRHARSNRWRTISLLIPRQKRVYQYESCIRITSRLRRSSRATLNPENNSEPLRLKVALRPLSFEPHPKSPRTFAKCVLATLEDIAHRFANVGVIQATSNIGNWR